MKILIDNADIQEIKKAYEYFPITGVTCNPTILKKTGRNPYDVLKEIREFIGADGDLHVQVVSAKAEDMVVEAHKIQEVLGKNTYIKIPVVREGLKAMKWVVVVALLLVAIVGNYLYRDIMLPLRALAVVILIAAAGGVALLTTKGKATVAFAREARTEVRKVIWPTRQETLHTTLIVAAVTAVMSLILWGLDGILVRLVSFITGLRF